MTLYPQPQYQAFQVFGLQRSGTTWLARSLATNYDLPERQEHWKHTLEDVRLSQECFSVGIIKHPYMWISSVANYSADIGKPAANVQQHNLVKSNPGTRDLFVSSLCELYTAWVHRWDNVIPIVKYEDMLREPTTTLERCGLTSTGHEWIHVQKVTQSAEFTDSARNRYLNCIHDLPDWVVDEIRSFIPETMFTHFSYRAT